MVVALIFQRIATFTPYSYTLKNILLKHLLLSNGSLCQQFKDPKPPKQASMCKCCSQLQTDVAGLTTICFFFQCGNCAQCNNSIERVELDARM